MQIDIITADKTLFSGEAEAISLPGAKGRFQVLKNHAALISSLVKGVIKITTKAGDQSFEIGGGIVEVASNKVIVLA